MKRKVLFTLFLLLPMLAVSATDTPLHRAKEPVFILRRDSVLRDFSLNEKIFSKGDRFYCYTDDIGEHGLGVPISDPLRIDIFLSDSNGKGYVGNINDVYLEDNNLKIDTDIKNSYWIPSYYYELLESRNVKSDLLKYESHWRTFKNQSIEPYRRPCHKFCVNGRD